MRTILLGAAAAVAISAGALAQGNPGGDGGPGQAQPPIMNNQGGAGGQRMQGGAEAPRAATPDAPRRNDAAQRQPMDQGGAGQRRTDQGDADRAAENQPGRANTGNAQRRDERPTAAGNVGSRMRINIGATQKTVIKSNIVRTNVTIPAGVTIAVGSVLPASIAFQPVPAAIIAEVPELEPYYYVVVDGEIVFVDPASYAIVYVMPLA